MEITCQRFGELCVGAPRGRIDQTAAGGFERSLLAALEDPKPSALVLDFSRVEYISSAGLRVVMMAARELRSRSAHLAVAAMQPVVEEIFAISRFHHVVGIHPSVREAVRAVAPTSLDAYDAAGGVQPP